MKSPIFSPVFFAHRRSGQGLTLVELLISLTLVSTLLFLAIPLFQFSELDQAARLMKADLNYARMLAIKKRFPCRVLFDDNGTTYTIHVDQDNDGLVDQDERVMTKRLSDRLPTVIFSTNRQPVFLPTGVLKPFSNGTLRLTDQVDSLYVIYSWAGRIRISDTPP